MADFENAEPKTADEHEAINDYFSFINGESAADLHFVVEKSY
jgi:hypothetical protein